MTGTRVAELAEELLSALDAACAPSASEADMLAALRDYGSVTDRLDAVGVRLIAAMTRRGIFAEHGYQRPEYAIADLLGWDRRPARRRVKLAEQVCSRVSLDGQVLPAVLPATAMAFTEGRLGVPHAEAIVAILNSPAARRLDPHTWAGAEEQIARYAAQTRCTPNEIDGWAKQLIEALDQDGAEPADEPDQVNELHLSRNRCGTGGRVKGELDGPTFEALCTALAALCKPRPDVTGTLPRRQADALGELCEFTLRHDGSLPDTGGERPQVRVTLDWEALRGAVAGAHLDTGAWFTTTQLRMLACDACVIPAILGANSEPLDIGRATRTIPAGIRRAVAIRDRGCAYPGCHRPPAHCDVHHCTEWALGGVTAIHNCTMLCRAHHLIVHGAGWTVRIRDGHPEFIPPEFIDPHQRLRRRPAASMQ